MAKMTKLVCMLPVMSGRPYIRSKVIRSKIKVTEVMASMGALCYANTSCSLKFVIIDLVVKVYKVLHMKSTPD